MRPVSAAGCARPRAAIGSRLPRWQSPDHVAEFSAKCSRVCRVSAEPGRELPVLDGFGGLIHAPGHKQ